VKARAGGTHERLVDEVVTGSSNRAFGFTFAIVFTILALWPLVRGRSMRGWALMVAAVFFLAALALPRVLAPLSRLWLRFGLVLHACISPIFTTVTPIGLVRRLLGQDPLQLRFARDAVTYWIERHPPGPPPDTMPRQF